MPPPTIHAAGKATSNVKTIEVLPDLDETTPLLSSSLPTPDSQRSKSTPSPKTLVTIILLGVLLASLGDQLNESPQTRILESIICYRYFEKADPSKIAIGRGAIGPGAIGGVSEIWCKTPPVQDQLAALRGWQQLFDGIPSLFLAIPAGWAADKFGRKPIVLLGLLAFALRAAYIQLITFFWQAFDVRMVWFSTIFASIGGGNTATSSGFFVMLSDLTTEANRAEAFVRINAFNLLASLVMPPLAAVLMEVTPWIPALLGTVLQLVVIPIFLYIPETLGYLRSSPSPRGNRTPPASAETQPLLSDFPTRLVSKLKASTAFLTADLRVLALIVPFPATYMIAGSGQLLLQYISARYTIKLSKAIIITTVRWAVISFLLFIGLPFLSKAMTSKLRLSSQRRDLYLTRASLVLLSLGWTLTGIAPNIITVIISLTLTALGHGASPLLRSFLTSLIARHHIARMYGVISIVDTLGAMLGAPLLAKLFQRGFARGGYWVGLPFYFIGMLTASCAVLLFVTNLRKGEDLQTSIDEEPVA